MTPSVDTDLCLGDVMASVHPSLGGLLISAPWPEAIESICISEHASTKDAAQMMLRTAASMLLVVDDQGDAVGMILREQVASWGRERARPHSGHRDRGHLRAALAHEPS